MNTVISKKWYSLLSALFLVLAFQTTNIHSLDSTLCPIELVYQQFKGTFPRTQTLAYLDNKALRGQAFFTFGHRIDSIGKDFFSSLFTSTINNEVEHAETHYAFYHGQKQTFMLFQDIHNGLHKLAHQEALQNFFLLRNPKKPTSVDAIKDCVKKIIDSHLEKPSNGFASVADFLNFYMKNDRVYSHSFDIGSDIREQLLSVNPSLFGNTSYSGECTFRYFINSHSDSSPNTINLIENTFALFDKQEAFKKYNYRINELLGLLKQSTASTTGVLLQFLVPKNKVDSIAYCCHDYGRIDWTDEPLNHPASKDLEYYKDNIVNTDSLDLCQFRILVTNLMLDPNSGIKCFRFFNETSITKEYQNKLKELFSWIAYDLDVYFDVEEINANTNCWTRCLKRWQQYF